MIFDLKRIKGWPAPRLITIKVRNNHLNTIRLFMAMLVIWSHCFAIYYGTEANEPISLLLAGHYNAGNVGVRVFFIISGFLITQSFIHNPDVKLFMKKRVARIYPGFLTAAAICIVVIIPLFSTRVEMSASDGLRIILQNLLLRGAMPESDAFINHPVKEINGALWSISFEFWCYIATAVLGVLGLLQRRTIIFVVYVTIVVTRIWLDLTGRQPGGGILDEIIGWPYLWFSIAPCFLIGALAYLFHEKIPRSGLLLLSFMAALVISAHTSKIACDLLFPIAAAYGTFYAAFSATRLPDAEKFGDFSYGTYLYGFPIQQMLRTLDIAFFPFILMSGLLAIAAGVASWFMIERHFVVQKKKTKSRLT